MKRRMFLVLASAVPDVLSVHAYGRSGSSPRAQSETTRKNGREMRDDIIAAYESLNASGKLQLTGTANDVGPTVGKYLCPGMPFADAEATLEAAGLSVGARQGPSPAGDRADRYDVYATSSSIFGQKLFSMRQQLMIAIRPDSNETYETVQSVTAGIYVFFL